MLVGRYTAEDAITANPRVAAWVSVHSALLNSLTQLLQSLHLGLFLVYSITSSTCFLGWVDDVI